MRYHQRAICLRAIDFSETSQVLTLLTRDEGKVRLMAKGTKRPKSKTGGAIDLLAEGTVVYSLRNVNTLGTLMEFSESVSRRALRRGARRLNVALLALEMTNASMADGDPHADVFDLLSNTLRRLADDDAPLDAVFAYFQWRLIRHVGLLGGLTACVGCGAGVEELVGGAQVYFSSQVGGLICDGCHTVSGEHVAISPAAMAGIATLAAAETGRRVALNPTQAQHANRLLCYHLGHQLSRRFKMAKYVV